MRPRVVPQASGVVGEDGDDEGDEERGGGGGGEGEVVGQKESVVWKIPNYILNSSW